MTPAHKKCLLFAVLFLLTIFCWRVVSAQSVSRPGSEPKPNSIPSDTAPTAAMHASISSQVIGTWRLVAYQEKLPNGDIANPYGDTPQGVAIFEPGGYVSVQMMKIPRVSFTSGYARATVDQVKAVHEAYLAYYGTWAIDEAESALIENIKASNQPYLNNQMTTQRYDFEGKRLSLRTVLTDRGEEHSVVFVWEKMH
jgi:hypothetical protein